MTGTTKPTTYVILGRRGSAWHLIGSEDAPNERTAIRRLITASDPELSEETQEKFSAYVAVPERSWNPRTISVEVQTRLVLNEAAHA